MEVGRIAQQLGISQPNASQHLALLRSSGLVEIERNGREIRYQLADPAGHGRVLDHARLSAAPDEPPFKRCSRGRATRGRRSRSMSEEPINLVLFSGTDDKLQAAAVLAAGAAALGKPVHVFLQYWALDAFRADRIDRPLPLAPEAGPTGQGGRGADAHRRPAAVGADLPRREGHRRGRYPGVLAVDGRPGHLERPARSACRRRRGRGRVLRQRRHGQVVFI